MMGACAGANDRSRGRHLEGLVAWETRVRSFIMGAAGRLLVGGKWRCCRRRPARRYCGRSMPAIGAASRPARRGEQGSDGDAALFTGRGLRCAVLFDDALSRGRRRSSPTWRCASISAGAPILGVPAQGPLRQRGTAVGGDHAGAVGDPARAPPASDPSRSGKSPAGSAATSNRCMATSRCCSNRASSTTMKPATSCFPTARSTSISSCAPLEPSEIRKAALGRLRPLLFAKIPGDEGTTLITRHCFT